MSQVQILLPRFYKKTCRPDSLGLESGRMKHLSLTIVALLVCFACGERHDSPEAPRPVVASITPSEPAPPFAAEQEPAAPVVDTPLSLSTEEAVIESLQGMISRQDIVGIQGLCTQEYAIDLRRLHDQDPHGFWRRGAILHRSISSGYEILHRQADTEDVWHVVVLFGDGVEERMSFSRVHSDMRLAGL